MTSLGFLNKSVMQLQSYLSNKTFQSKYSGTAKDDCGVLQESILGPLLFILYINNMKHPLNCDLVLYKGDPCLVYQQNKLKLR